MSSPYDVVQKGWLDEREFVPLGEFCVENFDVFGILYWDFRIFMIFGNFDVFAPAKPFLYYFHSLSLKHSLHFDFDQFSFSFPFSIILQLFSWKFRVKAAIIAIVEKTLTWDLDVEVQKTEWCQTFQTFSIFQFPT